MMCELKPPKMAICDYESEYFCKRYCRNDRVNKATICRSRVDHANIPCKYHAKRLLAALPQETGGWPDDEKTRGLVAVPLSNFIKGLL